MMVDIVAERCVGCGLCEENHPDIFSMGKRIALVLSPRVPTEEVELVIETAEDCPADAILIRK